MIRVVLPQHLRTLAHVSGEVMLEVADPVTQRRVLDALEARYPILLGTIRDHVTQERRPFLRSFAGGGEFGQRPVSGDWSDRGRNVARFRFWEVADLESSARALQH